MLGEHHSESAKTEVFFFNSDDEVNSFITAPKNQTAQKTTFFFCLTENGHCLSDKSNVKVIKQTGFRKWAVNS